MVGSGDRFDRAAVGLEAKIVSTQVDLSLQRGAGYRGSAVRPGHVDPIVLAPARIVDGALDDVHLEAIEEGFADIRLAVSSAVVQVDDPEGGDGDDAAAGGDDAEAGRQVVSPGVGPVHAPIAIGVVQELDPAVGLFPGLGQGLWSRVDPPDFLVQLSRLVQLDDVEMPLEVVAVNLADEQAALFIPGDARGVGDERLTGDQLDLQPLRKLKAPQALSW